MNAIFLDCANIKIEEYGAQQILNQVTLTDNKLTNNDANNRYVLQDMEISMFIIKTKIKLIIIIILHNTLKQLKIVLSWSTNILKENN